MVPIPLGVRRNANSFLLSRGAGLCAGVRNKRTQLLRDCLRTLPIRLGGKGGGSARGMLSLLVARGDRRLPSPRDCALSIAPRQVLVHTASKTKLFCKVRALLRLSRPSKANCSVTSIRIRSDPHFTCHNLVLSMSHRFFSGRFIGGRVSTLTFCGVGHLRLRLASTTN